LIKRITAKLGIATVLFVPTIVLATNEPMDIVKAWAKATKERDGKKQYQLLCSDQQDKNKAGLEALNWVTGVSSPGIGDYKISKLTVKRGTSVFLINYQIVLQTKPVGSVSDKLYIKNGCIAKFRYLSPAASNFK